MLTVTNSSNILNSSLCVVIRITTLFTLLTGICLSFATSDAIVRAAVSGEIKVERLGRYEGRGGAQNVQVVGHLAYVLARGWDDSNPVGELRILDISNAASPTLVGEVTSAIPGLPTSLLVVDSLAYVTYFHREGGLAMIDVRDARVPRLVGSYALPGSVWDVAVQDQRAYVTQRDENAQQTTGYLYILDVSNTAAPILLGTFQTSQWVKSVEVQGQLAYVGSTRRYQPEEADGGLQMIDISNPARPTLISSYRLYSADDLTVVGQRVHIGFVSADLKGGALFILDVADAANPQLLGSINVATLHLRVAGGIAYAAASDTSLYSGLSIVDVGTPQDPKGLLNTGFGVEDVFVVGDLVYIVEQGALQILRLRFQTAEPAVAPRCFAETAWCLAGRLRTFWEAQGGLPVFGFPLAPRTLVSSEGQVRFVQWFEHHRLELHPENAPPYDVLLGRLGVAALGQQGRDWQTFPPGVPQPGCRYMEATRHSICGEFLAAWQAHGLELDGQPGTTEAESLALFGLPLSEAQPETLSDGRVYTVQWFERARFELHPENPPPYRVLFGRLGAEVYHE